MLIGAAMYMYVDALKPPALLSLCLQEEKLDMVSGIKYLLKSIKSLRIIAEQDPLSWPTVKPVLSRLNDEEGKKVYQGAVLAGYNSTILKACADSALADVKRLEMEMKARLEWSNLELLRATIVFLDTKSWKRGEEAGDLSEIQAAVGCIVFHF